jgi:cation:H+ antiporter
MIIVYLVFGFALLIKGADWLVGSASKLAASFGIPSMVIGLTVVAFGTSAPESAIGILSAIDHTNQITLGDVIGSSIANIALIIGITSVISPLAVDRKLLTKELLISFIIQLVFITMALLGGVVSKIDGIILLSGFLLFLVYLMRTSKNSLVSFSEGTDTTADESRIKLIAVLIVGLVCLVFGGNVVVDTSTSIAHRLGLSEAMIGVTIVALGTSLPELVTCIVAAVRKENDIAAGNIIGSNIFNILFVLGLSSAIHPIEISRGIYIDSAFMLFATILLFLFAFKQNRITRQKGIILVFLYLFFIAYKVIALD